MNVSTNGIDSVIDFFQNQAFDALGRKKFVHNRSFIGVNEDFEQFFDELSGEKTKILRK